MHRPSWLCPRRTSGTSTKPWPTRVPATSARSRCDRTAPLTKTTATCKFYVIFHIRFHIKFVSLFSAVAPTAVLLMVYIFHVSLYINFPIYFQLWRLPWSSSCYLQYELSPLAQHPNWIPQPPKVSEDYLYTLFIQLFALKSILLSMFTQLFAHVTLISDVVYSAQSYQGRSHILCF